MSYDDLTTAQRAVLLLASEESPLGEVCLPVVIGDFEFKGATRRDGRVLVGDLLQLGLIALVEDNVVFANPDPRLAAMLATDESWNAASRQVTLCLTEQGEALFF